MHTIGEVNFNREGKPVWFSGTMQDITGRKRAALELQQLNEDLRKRAAELKASNTELERFAYVASHDLQEPLRMVTSFLGFLKKKHNDAFDETSQKYIHFTVDGAERMKALIQDLLQYSQLGASAENFTSVDLQEVVRDVTRVYAATISENEAFLNSDSLPQVWGSKVQITQLFQNLIGNSLKYRSLERPHIQLHCTEEDSDWLFKVKDNGIGIDPQYFEKIFVIFQQLHPKSENSGTGIGLAVCKKVVENHGAKIWVESQPDCGSFPIVFDTRKR